MSAADWEDLKEELCTELLRGKENGEAELETMARILWLERERYLTLTISERLQQFFKAALEAVEKPVNPPVGGERGADSDKSKLLKWKTRSRSLGAPPTSRALRKGRLHPSHAGRAVGLVAIKREEHPGPSLLETHLAPCLISMSTSSRSMPGAVSGRLSSDPYLNLF
jgi:hypothetical protein